MGSTIAGARLVLVAIILLRLGHVSAIPLSDFYSYGVRIGDQALPRSDDGSSPAIELEVPFRFFGRERSTVFVNNNGMISFGNSQAASVPQSFPRLGERLKIIAPFWSDVDTRVGTGGVFYRQTNASDLLQKAGSEIRRAFRDFRSFVPSLLLIATWDQVSSYQSETPTNTYQCVLATNGTSSFILFLYADDLMNWIISDQDGTHPALVGFNSGDGVTSLTLPTSRTVRVLDITTSSNVQKPGLWLFRSDSTDIKLPGVIVGMEKALYDVKEEAESATVCVSLLGEPGGDVVVMLETVEREARAGVDYTDIFHNLTFTPSTANSPLCVSITVTDDAIAEANETFSVSLLTSDDTVSLLPRTTLVTITDDDHVGMAFLMLKSEVNEESSNRGPSVINICAYPLQLAEKDIRVTMTTISGTAEANFDFTPQTNVLVFPAGSTNIRCRRFRILDDDIYEIGEIFYISLNSSDPQVDVRSPIAEVKIVDRDAAGVSVGFEKSAYAIGEGNSSVTVCTRLTGSEIGQPISVTVNPTTHSFLFQLSTPGGDYISLPQTLTFEPEDRLVPRCANITILEDSILEGTESFSVDLLRTDSSSDITLTRTRTRVDIIDNDVVHVALEQTEFTVHEISSRIQICANLTGEFERNVGVVITPTPGTARAGFNFDFTGGPRSITFRGQDAIRHKCAEIPLYNDFALERKVENFTVLLTSTNPAVIVTQGSATVNIIDNDVGLVSFTSASYRVRERISGSAVRVCVELTGGLEIPLSVNVSTQNNTALAGFDYDPMTIEVTFRLHDEISITECRTVEVRDDIIVEGEETFFLLLSSQSDRIHLERNKAQVTIEDNDVVNVNFVSMSYSVGEEEGNVEVCARMVGLNVNDVAVTMSTNDGTAKSGTEYVANSFRLVFPTDPASINRYLLNSNTVSLPESVQCANVTILDNSIVEQSTFKTFTMRLTSADSTVQFIAPTLASVNIFDNDLAVVSLDPTEHIVMENISSVSVCAVLQGEAEFRIVASLHTVDGTARAGSDYTSLRSRVHFVPGTMDPQCIAVTVTDDDVLEDMLQTFHVELSVVTDDDRVLLGQSNTATITIQDNDIGSVSFKSASYRVRERTSGSMLEVCVELTGGLEIPLSVTLSTQNNTALAGFDYVPMTIEVTFPLHYEASVTECRTVEVRDDIIVEGEETFFLLLSSQSDRVKLERNKTEITIEDNDVVNVNFVSMSYSVGEGEGNVEVCARMVGPNVKDVVVTMSTNEGTAKSGTEYVANSFRLVFPSAVDINKYLRNSNTISLPESVQCANVTILDNDIVEQSTFKTFTMRLTSADSTVQFIAPNTTSVNIFDNDVAVVSLDPTEYIVMENMSSVSVCAVLQGEAEFRIVASLHTVDGTARAGSDYTPLRSRVHFVPGTTDPQCIAVTVTDDDVLEDMLQTFHVNLSVVTDDDRVLLSQSNAATVTIQDNDIALVSFKSASYRVRERTSGSMLEVCVELTGGLEIPLSVTVSTQNNTALAGFDYVPTTIEVTFPLHYEASITECRTVEVRDDIIVEGEETFFLLLSSQSDRVKLERNKTEITIEDNDVVNVNFVSMSYSVGEEEGNVEVCARMVGPIVNDVVVTMSTNEGTAKAGTEYVANSFRLVFPSAVDINKYLRNSNTISLPESVQCANVTILNNNIVEQSTFKTFTMRLTSADSAVQFIAPNTTSVNIFDNDVAVVSLDPTEYIAMENMSSVSVCAVLQGEAEFRIVASLHTVDGTARAGSDYTSLRSRVHFVLGTTDPQCIAVTVTDDDVLEDMLQTFHVNLSVVTDDDRVLLGQSNTATVTIQDNDMVEVGIAKSSYTVLEEEGMAEVCVELTGLIERSVAVNISTVPNGQAEADIDYDETSATLVYEPSASAEQLLCLEILIQNDTILENTESFDVTISTIDKSVNLTRSKVPVYIQDDDGVRVSIEHREYSIQEGEGVLTVCTTLDGAIERNVQLMLHTVPNTAQAGRDFVDATVLLTYESEDEMQCAGFEILNDDIYESVETFTIALNITQQAVSIHIGSSTVSIHDNDHVNVSFQNAAYSVVEEEGSVGVCVDLNGRTERNVPIHIRTTSLTAQGGRDYEDDPIQTHFSPSLSMNQTLCVDFPIERDAILEHVEEFRAHLSSNAHRVAVIRESAVVMIIDDDAVIVEFGAEEYNVSEDTETEVELCVMLEGVLERQVLVNVTTVTELGTATAGDDFIPVALNFTFDPTVVLHCFNIMIKDDLLVEGSEEFFVSLSTADSSVSLVPLTTVRITDEDVLCPANRTESFRGNYVWEERPPNRDVELPCQFGEALPGGMVRRFCGPGGRWEDPRLLECYADADALFDALFKATFSKDNLRELYLVVDQVTKVGNPRAEYMKVIAQVFEEFAKLVDDDNIIVDTESFTYVLEIVNNIQKWDANILQHLSSRVVRSVETISVGRVKRENFTDWAHHADNLAFKAEYVDVEELKLYATERSYRDDGNGTLNVTIENPEVNRTLDEDQVGHISLPRSVFDGIIKTNVELIFSLYKTPVLFPLTNDSKNFSEITSPVVAASVAGESITNLSKPITILLKLDPEFAAVNYSDVRCVSWDFNAANKTGNWTDEGCKTESVKDDIVNCSCTHLTNFACLVDIRSRVGGEGPSEEVRFALEILSIFGVVLSLIGLTLTIITLLVFRKLRQRDSTKFRVQLCISMALMMITFVAGIDRTEIFYACIVVSSLIHYFTLVTVMWMGAEALLMFEKLIIVFTKCSTKYMVLVTLICWLLPIPAVVIPPAINTNFTIGSDPDFCFISHTYVFFGAFLGPIFLVLVFNIIIFILALGVIIRHTRKKFKELKTASKWKGTLRIMFGLCGVMVLFGFSWAFAAFTVKGVSEVFQFLFVVFNSLQGFFIFLFFVVFEKEAQELWLRLCGCKRKKYHVTATSSRTLNPKKSTTSFDSVPELDIDDKKDVEAPPVVAHQRPTTHSAVEFISSGSVLGEKLSQEQQLEEQQMQSETEDDGHSTTDSGITADRKTESTGDTQSTPSPASIKKIQEVETGDFVTYGEACSTEALHNIETSADHIDPTADHTDTASDESDHTVIAIDHTDTAVDHTDIAVEHISHDLETPLPGMSTEDSTNQRGQEETITQTLDAASDGASHQAEESAESKPVSGSQRYTESETAPPEDGGKTVVVDPTADHTDTASDESDHTVNACDHTDTAVEHISHDLETPLPGMSTEDSTNQRGQEEAITQTLDTASDGASHHAEESAESKSASGSQRYTESETAPPDDGGKTVVVVD